MPGQTGISADVATWIEARQDGIARSLRASRYALRQDDAQRETLDLLGHLAAIEREARNAVHLLTTYASRAGVATPTQVAAATETTVSTSSNRAGSALAQRLWAEVHDQAKSGQP